MQDKYFSNQILHLENYFMTMLLDMAPKVHYTRKTPMCKSTKPILKIIPC